VSGQAPHDASGAHARTGTALYKSDCSQQVETAINAGFTHLGELRARVLQRPG
jgi:hypothetical protein